MFTSVHPILFHVARLVSNCFEDAGWWSAVALCWWLLRDRTGGHRRFIALWQVFFLSEALFHVEVICDLARYGHVEDWFWSAWKVIAFWVALGYSFLHRANLRRTLQFSEAARIVGALGLTPLAATPELVTDAKEEEHRELRAGTLEVSQSLRQQLEETLRKGSKQHAGDVGEGLVRPC